MGSSLSLANARHDATGATVCLYSFSSFTDSLLLTPLPICLLIRWTVPGVVPLMTARRSRSNSSNACMRSSVPPRNKICVVHEVRCCRCANFLSLFHSLTRPSPLVTCHPLFMRRLIASPLAHCLVTSPRYGSLMAGTLVVPSLIHLRLTIPAVEATSRN